MDFDSKALPDLINDDNEFIKIVEQPLPINQNLIKLKDFMKSFYSNYIEQNLIVIIILLVFSLIFLYLFIIHKKKQRHSKKKKQHYKIIKKKFKNDSEDSDIDNSSLSNIDNDPNNLINEPFSNSNIINKEKYNTNPIYDRTLPTIFENGNNNFEQLSKNVWTK